MAHRRILVDTLPRLGPYSHAVEAGDTLYLSGIVPVDVQSGRAEKSDVRAGTALIFEQVQRVLAAAGYTLADVVKCTVFLADMAEFAAMNEVYASVFTSNPPARSCVAAAALPGGYPIEIDVVAVRSRA